MTKKSKHFHRNNFPPVFALSPFELYRSTTGPRFWGERRHHWSVPVERGGDHGILGREDLLLRGVHRDQELGADRRPLPGNEEGRGPHESFHQPGAGAGG